MNNSAVMDFWRLAVQSRLLTADQGKELAREYLSMSGAAGGAPGQGNAKTLAEWLVSRNIISRYQAKVLLAGKAGPFQYGDYQVYDRESSGRLSGLFRAVHVPTRHPVLLQFVAGDTARDPKQWTLLASHAQMLAHTEQPRVAACYEPVDVGSHKFLVLEDLRGRSLEERLADGALPAEEAAHWAREAALAIDALGRAGVTHGDIRPSQIWLGEDGGLRLFPDLLAPLRKLDWREADATGETLERADYAAPELADKPRPDPLSDLYALGCVLYQMLSGRPPFAGGDVASKHSRHAKEAIAPLDPRWVPPGLAQVVSYLMAKNRDVRYQRGADAAEHLLAFIGPTWQALPQPTPPATLAAYRRQVRQKQQELLAKARNQAAPVVAPVGVGAKPGVDLPRGAAAPRVAVGDATEEGGTRPGRRRAKAGATPWVIGGTLSAAALVTVLLVAFLGGDGSTTSGSGDDTSEDVKIASNVGTSTPGTLAGGSGTSGTGSTAGGANTPGTSGPGATTNSSTGNPADVAEPAGPEYVADDGMTLWGAPTSGAPIDWSLAPAAGVAYGAVRPAELLGSDAGRRFVNSLGPAFVAWRETWERAAGVSLDQVEQLRITWVDNGDELPRPAYAVRLTNAKPIMELLGAWQEPVGTAGDAGVVYKSDSLSYYVPTANTPAAGAPAAAGAAPTPVGNAASGEVAPGDAVIEFALGGAEDMQDVADRRGVAPTMRSAFAKLAEWSDAEQQLTLLVTPFDLDNKFFRDGRNFYFGDPIKVREPLAWLLGEGLEAVQVSLHVDDSLLYVESRLLPEAELKPVDLAARLREHVGELRPRLLEYLARLTPGPYWSKFAFQFPAMLQQLTDHTRIQVEGQRNQEQVVMNAILPGIAAHNLAFGLEMTLASTPGAAVAAGPTTVAEAPPKTLEELLTRKVTVIFDQQSLEASMKAIVAETKAVYELPFEFDIKLIGGDLEKNGITRNQQIRNIAERDKPIHEILTTFVMRANPVTTVKTPDELDQKLIWVIGPDPDDPSRTLVLITTRDAAAAKQYKLPAAFVPKQ